MFVIVLCFCAVQLNAIYLGRRTTGAINGIVGLGQQRLRHVLRRTGNRDLSAALSPLLSGPFLRRQRTTRTRTRGRISFGKRAILKVSV